MTILPVSKPRMLALLLVAGLFFTWPGAWGKGLSLSPAPDTDPAASIPPPAEETGSPANPIRLQVEKQGIPKALLFRQLNPQIYPRFEAKTKPLQQALKETLDYLDKVEQEKTPSLQRISAYSAEASLEWRLLEARLQPEERAFRSYQLMKTAVMELRGLSNYWVTANRVKRVFRGTLREEQTEREILATKREKIRQALSSLQEFNTLKDQLNAELPY